MTERAVEIAAFLCQKFEGFSAVPYLCPAGVSTIGFGTTRYPWGRPVTLADPSVTLAQADTMLCEDLKKRASALKILSPGLEMEPAKLAAILDFTYNLGTTAYRASSLKLAVDEQYWDEVEKQLRRWVYARGKILPGLVRRREAEIEYIRQ